MSTIIDKKIYSEQEYLLLEESSLAKHEFINGELFEMAGTTVLHNEICLKLFILLFSELNKLGYRVLVENVKLNINHDSQVFLYPDIIVTNEIIGSPNAKFVTQPILLAEILSDSTRNYDMTDKFIQYRKISTLQYYITIEPTKQIIYLFEKSATGEWSTQLFTELTDIIQLPLLNISFNLAAIYK